MAAVDRDVDHEAGEAGEEEVKLPDGTKKIAGGMLAAVVAAAVVVLVCWIVSVILFAEKKNTERTTFFALMTILVISVILSLVLYFWYENNPACWADENPHEGYDASKDAKVQDSVDNVRDVLNNDERSEDAGPKGRSAELFQAIWKNIFAQIKVLGTEGIDKGLITLDDLLPELATFLATGLPAWVLWEASLRSVEAGTPKCMIMADGRKLTTSNHPRGVRGSDLWRPSILLNLKVKDAELSKKEQEYVKQRILFGKHRDRVVAEEPTSERRDVIMDIIDRIIFIIGKGVGLPEFEKEWPATYDVLTAHAATTPGGRRDEGAVVVAPGSDDDEDEDHRIRGAEPMAEAAVLEQPKERRRSRQQKKEAEEMPEDDEYWQDGQVNFTSSFSYTEEPVVCASCKLATLVEHDDPRCQHCGVNFVYHYSDDYQYSYYSEYYYYDEDDAERPPKDDSSRVADPVDAYPVAADDEEPTTPREKSKLKPPKRWRDGIYDNEDEEMAVRAARAVDTESVGFVKKKEVKVALGMLEGTTATVDSLLSSVEKFISVKKLASVIYGQWEVYESLEVAITGQADPEAKTKKRAVKMAQAMDSKGDGFLRSKDVYKLLQHTGVDKQTAADEAKMLMNDNADAVKVEAFAAWLLREVKPSHLTPLLAI